MNKQLFIPRVIIIGGVLIGGALLLSGNNKGGSLSVNIAQASLRKADLEIKNMFCLGCRASIVNSVIALPGVVQADADPGTDSGWVIYDPSKITKEQIIALPIFQVYPVRILKDEKYTGDAQQVKTAQIPPEVEQKLNLLAQKLKERGVQLEPFFQKELDDAINGGYWDKANNLLDNLLKNLYERKN
jgi:copper chaperone CopZ